LFLTIGADIFIVVFFFQAEDGIRDRTVTGVQTCALPISWNARLTLPPPPIHETPPEGRVGLPASDGGPPHGTGGASANFLGSAKIGRASCRERVEMAVVAGVIKKNRSINRRARSR